MQKQPARSARTVTLWVAAFSLVAGSAVLPAREPAAATNPLSAFFNRNDQPLKQYRAYRRMHAAADKGNHEAWMEAWTELKDGHFSYQVVNERGSDLVRGKVLKAMLEREEELVNSGNTDKGELTSDNYEFSEAGRNSEGSHVVEIKPKRKDVLLVDGHAVLNDGGDLVRVEGRLAKNPSFWTSLVNVIRHYARIDGVRVPISTETTAKVKFAGVSQLDVQYDYETINGRPVSVAAHRALPPPNLP